MMNNGNGRRRRLALVGNGLATTRLLDDLLRRGAGGSLDITVFGEERGGAYNRVLLSRVLGGEHPDTIQLKSPGWYEAEGIRFIEGARVARLDTAARTVHTEDGRSFGYDAAVLATGSVPFVPPMRGALVDGRPRQGVFAYRTLGDVVRMRDYAAGRADGGRAVVLGGGLLGLEAAKGLADAGLHVTVVHRAAGLMNAQLDAEGGAVLRGRIESFGIAVETGHTITAVCGGVALDAVELNDSRRLRADLLVLATGIRPRADLAEASGIPTNRGVLVDDALATAAPDVYALGECAEHAGEVYGIVAPIWEQSAVLADVLSGANPAARYHGSRLYTRLKVAGVEVAAMGLLEPASDADEVVQVVEPRRRSYRKLIVRDGRLVGAMLVGDTDAAARLVQLFDRGEALPDDRLASLCAEESLLGGGSNADREVCNCNKVNASTLVAAIGAGADTVEALADRTRAGTGCGSCRGQLARLIALNVPKAPIPVAH